MQVHTTYETQQSNTATLPLGQAIRALPAQYLKILCRPSVQSFVEEKDKGGWGIIWIQLIVLGVIGAILQSLALVISPPIFSNVASAGLSQSAVLTISIVFVAIAEIVLTPVSFLATGGILFLLARLFGGKGTYREQIYTTLLYGFPLVTLSYLLFLIPVAGTWLIYTPHIYSIILLFISMKTVHRFGTVKQEA